MTSAPPASATAANKRWLLAPLVGFAIVAAVFGVALRSGDPSKLPSALIGKPAPAITGQLAQLDGLKPGATVAGRVKAPALIGQGHPVLVNFFASWCPPCRVEHPVLMQLASTSDLTILGIDHKDTAVNGRRLLENLGNPYQRVVIDGDGRAAIEWGVYGMPETFLVDARGTVVWKHVGALTPEVVAGSLATALAKAK